MLPYLDIPALHFGSLIIAPFGVMVLVAIIAGAWCSWYTAEKEFGGGNTFLHMMPWFLIPGFFFAHLATIVFYEAGTISWDRIHELFLYQSGLSSFGGLFGGTAAAVMYTKIRKLPTLQWLDVLARGFAFSFIFGRIGCAIAHDHPGTATDFILGVQYPAHDGLPAIVRHDHGYYEVVIWLVISGAFFMLSKKTRVPGFFLGMLILFYAPIRLILDFYRINDTTISGLTFAQWSALAVIPIGLLLVYKATATPKTVAAPLNSL